MRVLVVEDEEAIGLVLRRGLTEARYQVDLATDGKTGLQLALENEYQLIVLDLMLPGMDGFQICRELRRRRIATPILMLTARDAVDDRIQGLDTGADDYLPKPFDFNELLARLRALLRRDKVHKGRQIQIADLELDTVSRRVTRAGKEISLTPREYALLEALASNEGRVLSREVILERVWMDLDSLSNTVDVHVGALRRKVDSGQAVRLIHTVHGVGYTLKRDAG